MEIINQNNLNPKYCSKSLGEILYRDKLMSITKYENVANLLKRYSRNTEFNESILNDLKKEIDKDTILNINVIDKFNYDEEFLFALNNLSLVQNGTLALCNGLIDVGYIEFNSDFYISKDLQTTYGLNIFSKNIINKVLVKEKKPIRILSNQECSFINELIFEEHEKVLLVGCDLGYLAFKHPSKKIYVYEEDDEIKNFLKENVYNKLNLDITFISEEEILSENFDKIIINPSFDDDLQLKLFSSLKLYNSDKLISNKINLILTKFKLDLQDLIMTDKEQVVDSLIESLKEMKGIGQLILNEQLSFIEKAEKYLDSNNLYFDNYKKYQKFINDNKNIYKILIQD